METWRNHSTNCGNGIVGFTMHFFHAFSMHEVRNHVAIFGAVVKVHEVHPYGKSPRERHNFAKNAPNPGKAAALIQSEKEAGH